MRQKGAQKQIRRGDEIRRSLVLAGFNILLTWALTLTALTGHLTLSSDVGFYLWFPGVSALHSHVLGSLFLYLYYKTSHPWRELFIWQRKEQIKEGVTEEVPCWEQVS